MNSFNSAFFMNSEISAEKNWSPSDKVSENEFTFLALTVVKSSTNQYSEHSADIPGFANLRDICKAKIRIGVRPRNIFITRFSGKNHASELSAAATSVNRFANQIVTFTQKQHSHAPNSSFCNKGQMSHIRRHSSSW